MQAVDSNVLFDVLSPDSEFYEDSAERLEAAADEGPLAICDVVYAELGTHFSRQPELDRFLDETDLVVVRASHRALYAASSAWQRYTARKPHGLICSECGTVGRPSCSRCGARLRTRQRLIADFMVGAHALVDCAGLITRDKRYYQTYFPDLALL